MYNFNTYRWWDHSQMKNTGGERRIRRLILITFFLNRKNLKSSSARQTWIVWKLWIWAKHTLENSLGVLAHIYWRVPLQQIDVFLQVVQLLFQHGFPLHFRHRVGEHWQQQKFRVQRGPVRLQPLHGEKHTWKTRRKTTRSYSAPRGSEW